MSVSVTLQVGKLTLKNLEIEHIEVHQELGAHTTCAVGFSRHKDNDVKLEELLGMRMSVVVSGDGAEHEPLFVGTVSGGSQTPFSAVGSAYWIDGISSSVYLEYHDTAYFADATIQDVAARLNVAVAKAGPVGPKLDYVQYGESNFDFLLRIAEEAGYFLKTSAPSPQLYHGFNDKSWPLRWQDNLTSITAAANLVNHGFKGAFYQLDKKQDHRYHQVRQGPQWTGGAGPLVGKVSELASRFAGGGDAHMEEFSTRATSTTDYVNNLKRKSARILGNAVRVAGASTNPDLCAGDTCMVADGQKTRLQTAVAGKYGLTTVVHTWDGHHYSNRFTATPWAEYTSTHRTPRHLIPGLVTAEVMQNEDSKHLGRLKVRFHWQEKDGQSVTRWVRIASSHAGKERGIYFMPEVGDEVVVAFEQGDPERPVIVGNMWNGIDVSPQSTKGNNAKRIVTKSGNTVQFFDDAGKEIVEIYSAQAQCFVQLANSANGKPLVTVRSGGDISFEAEGDIRFKCTNLTHQVSADSFHKTGANFTVQAGQNAVTKAGQGVALEGTNTTMKAAANIFAIAGAMNNIAGSMVQIQPPGVSAPPVNTKEPPAKTSVWSKREVPAKAPPLKSSSDTRLPRSND